MTKARWTAMMVAVALWAAGLRASAQSAAPSAESPALPAVVPPAQQDDSEAPSTRRPEKTNRRDARAEARRPPPPDWQPGLPVPEGFHPASAARRSTMGLGIAMLGISFGASTAVGLVDIVGSIGTADGETTTSAKQPPPAPLLNLFVPVVGPFLAAHAGGCAAICIVDGAAQTAGLGLIVFSLVAREPVLVHDRLALSVAPARLGTDGQGVELFGRF
jgi:hypothetical protein